MLADQFWTRWLREYLLLLQQRQKWLLPQRNFSQGDLILVGNDHTKRGLWPKGLVEEVFRDKNGLVRSVRIRTASSPSLIRDVRKLYLLEAAE